jgi:hypothetical protein
MHVVHTRSTQNNIVDITAMGGARRRSAVRLCGILRQRKALANLHAQVWPPLSATEMIRNYVQQRLVA